MSDPSSFDGNFWLVMSFIPGHIVPYSDDHETRALST
jgi:hypothetical protein